MENQINITNINTQSKKNNNIKNKKDSNSSIIKNNNTVTITLRGDIYKKDEIIESSYMMLDRAFVTITGEIGKEVIILLSAKPGYETLDLEKTYHEELIQAVHNQKQDESNAELQKTIMTALLFSETINDNNNEKTISNSLNSEAQAFLSDTFKGKKVEKQE